MIKEILSKIYLSIPTKLSYTSRYQRVEVAKKGFANSHSLNEETYKQNLNTDINTLLQKFSLDQRQLQQDNLTIQSRNQNVIMKRDPSKIIERNEVEEVVVPWFPKVRHEITLTGNDMMFEGEQENKDHIQFNDKVYQKRREEIANISKSHIFGEEIPTVEYTQQEEEIWVKVYSKLKYYHQNICPEMYLNHLRNLENRIGIHQKIPQLKDLDAYLYENTRFRIKTAQGLLSQREFLNALAHRVFFCTQYIRHHSSPDYSPEPDLIHEAIGHIPQLADPIIADICQQIGLLSLGASDQELNKLGNLFFFTIEYGCYLENGQIKGYGAGIASSTGEAENFLSGKAKFEKFNPFIQCLNEYPAQDIQHTYYYSDSLEENLKQLMEFGETIKKPINLWYNSLTQEIESNQKYTRKYKNNNRPSN